MSNELAVRVGGIIESVRSDFNSSISDNSISFVRECAFAMQLFEYNEYLCKVALSNPNSARYAVKNLASIGITLNPAQKLAYLVPRKGGVCLDISYMGMMHIAQKSGSILWCQSAIVRKNDKFRRVAIDQPPSHEFNDFDTIETRGDIVGAYVVVKVHDGSFLTHTMRIEDIYATRDRSDAWKSHKNGRGSCPWVTDEEQMILKTVIKQAYKYWPRTERLDAAIDYSNTQGGEGITFNLKPGEEIANTSPYIIDDILNILHENGKSWDDLAPVIKKSLNKEVDTINELSDNELKSLREFLIRRFGRG